MDEHFGGGDVGGDGNVAHVAKTQQIHLVGFVRFRTDGIAEEQKQVDLVAGDAGRDLLVAPVHAGQKALDGQAGGLAHQLAGGAGGQQVVLTEHPAVSDAELHHQFLLRVMRDQCDVHGRNALLLKTS